MSNLRLFNSRVLNGADSLEALAYGLQILLALNRPDLARRQLKLMQDKDDDATLTQLAQAWLHLVQVITICVNVIFAKGSRQIGQRA